MANFVELRVLGSKLETLETVLVNLELVQRVERNIFGEAMLIFKSESRDILVVENCFDEVASLIAAHRHGYELCARPLH